MIFRTVLVILIALGTAAHAQMADKTEIARTLFLEAIRAAPSLADETDPLRFALMTYVDPGSSKTFGQLPTAEQQQKLDAAGAWIRQQLQQPPALPLKIEVALPAAIQVNDDGTVRIRAGSGKQPKIVSGTLDALKVQAPLQSPGVEIYPVQPFDLSALRPPAAVQDRLEGLARSRQGVMIVAQLTITRINPTVQTRVTSAAGQVETLAIHEMTAVNREVVPGNLIWTLPAPEADADSVTLANVEQALRLRSRDGRYLDERQGGASALNQLMQWRALTALPIEEVLSRRLSPELFWQAYLQMAPRALQDRLISPDKLSPGRDRFAPHINDIEQRDLEDRTLRALLPQIAAVLPQDPIAVTSTVAVPMSDYDFDKGGFAVTFRAGGWLLGTQYPVVSGLPDFFRIGQNEATQILDRMALIDGPGRKFLTLYAELGLRARETVFAPDGPIGLPRITPGFDLSALSLHAGSNHPDHDSLQNNKLLDLDPQDYRGAEQPIADRDELALWGELSGDPGARGEDLIAAALQVAEDRAAFAQAMNRRGQADDPLAAAQALAMPDPPVLTGTMTFVKQGNGWSANGFRWTYRSNESGLDAPQVELADTSILTNLPLSDAQDSAMQAIGGSVQYRALFTPVTTAIKGGRPTVFVRLQEIALFSHQKDETGLPLLRVILKKEPGTAQPEAPQSAELPDRPEIVMLDHDFLDLLQVRETGDSLDEATLDRMFLDRLHRELRTQNDADLPWGRFFDPIPQRLNRVERAAMLPAFQAWQTARAAALPERVMLRVATNPISAGCAALSYAHPSQVNGFSPGVKTMLEGLDYAALAQSVGNTLGMLEKTAQKIPERKPVLADTRLTQIGGRPIYQLYRTARHPSVSACVGQERLDAVTDGFDPAASQTTDAVIVLNHPILIANERRQVVETRHLARLADIAFVPGTPAGPGPRHAGTFRIDLDVTDSIFYGQDALPQRHMPNPTGKPVRLSVAQVESLRVPAPQVSDIKGMGLETSAEDMEIALIANGTGQRAYTQSFARQFSPKPVPGSGTLPATEAITDATMLIDLPEHEAILSLSDSRTGTPRLGLGRIKLYDPAAVTSDGLAGALIKKYGEPRFAEADRRGGRPLNRYVWGYHPAISMPYCLPQMNETAGRQMRDTFRIDNDEDRRFLDLANALTWPQFGSLTEAGPDFGLCQPIVIAEISTHADKLSLSTWVIDPAVLSGLEWGGDDDTPKTAGELVKEAADIDL